MRTRGVGLAVTALTVLALSPQVAAGKPTELRGQSPFLGPLRIVPATGPNAIGLGQVSSATATCPSGTQAVSGGFSAPANSTNTLAVYQSYRSSPQTWTASGVALSANGGAATAIAYCRKTRVTITEESATTTVPSGGGMVGIVEMTCSDDRSVAPNFDPMVSGGFRSTGGPGPTSVVIPQQSQQTGPSTWTYRAVNNGPGAQTLTVSVYCASGVKLPKPKTATITNSTVAAPTFGANDVSATPRCRSGKKGKKKGSPRPPGAPSSATSAKRKKKKQKQAEALAAGGFSTPPFGTPGNAITLITESRISGTSWLTRGVNVGPPATLTVTSQGLCR